MRSSLEGSNSIAGANCGGQHSKRSRHAPAAFFLWKAEIVRGAALIPLCSRGLCHAPGNARTESAAPNTKRTHSTASVLSVIGFRV